MFLILVMNCVWIIEICDNHQWLKCKVDHHCVSGVNGTLKCSFSLFHKSLVWTRIICTRYRLNMTFYRNAIFCNYLNCNYNIVFLKISKVKLILIIVCIFWVLTLFSVSAVWFSSSPLHRRWEEDSSFRHFVWGKILYYDSDMIMIIAKIMILKKNTKKHVCKLFRLP